MPGSVVAKPGVRENIGVTSDFYLLVMPTKRMGNENFHLFCWYHKRKTLTKIL
jgi:hypothetical protein